MNVGVLNPMLRASDRLDHRLLEKGIKVYVSAGSIVFREGADNFGVFLVLSGQVLLSMEKMPRLGRVFGSGSLLGLPSTFTGGPYCLTATAVTEAEVMHGAQADFLGLMRECSDLNGEITDMLRKEMIFIQSAVAERLRRNSRARIAAVTQGIGERHKYT